MSLAAIVSSFVSSTWPSSHQPGADAAPSGGARSSGTTSSVTALQSRLAFGIDERKLFALAGAPGRQGHRAGEWEWRDARGFRIVVAMRRGIVVRWEVEAPCMEPPLATA